MTKSEIIDYLSRNGTMERSDVHYIIDSFLSKIKESISNGEEVQIRGFGTFYKAEKKARKVHSPIAGKVIDVPAKTNIGFRPSKATEKEL
ncbi:MAG: integration host factor subunit beta [bacterium]|nr:integration host factor subunit beta [bacterium]